MAHKQYREAIDAYREGPRDSAVLANKIGIAYHQLLELNAAKKSYERAIRLDPSYAAALNNVGAIYYAARSYRRAIHQYNKAIALSPNTASMYSNLGTAYFARKKYKQALAAYQKALALDPDVFDRRGRTGVLLEERPVEERAKFHYYLAKSYAKAGMTDRALLCIRQALEEGFKDRARLKEDPEFAKMRNLPEFQQLLSLEPRVL